MKGNILHFVICCMVSVICHYLGLSRSHVHILRLLLISNNIPTPVVCWSGFLQGISIALLCKPCISYDRDVRLSVCPSVTRWHCVKTTQARITKSSPTDSPRTLVFGRKKSSRNSKGVTPSEGVKWEWGRKNSQFSANNSPYLRNGARQDQSYY